MSEPSRNQRDYPQFPVDRHVQKEYDETVITDVMQMERVDVDAIDTQVIDRMYELLHEDYHVRAGTPTQIFYCYVSPHWGIRTDLLVKREQSRYFSAPKTYTEEHEVFKVGGFSSVAYCYECGKTIKHASHNPRWWCDGCFDRDFVIEHGLSKLRDTFGDRWFEWTEIKEHWMREWVGVSVGSFMALARGRVMKRDVDPTNCNSRNEYYVPSPSITIAA